MRRALIYTSPAPGHLYPIMDVAIELKTKGIEVYVQSLSSEKELVMSEGLNFRSISPVIESLPLKDYMLNNPLSQLRSTFKCWLSRAKYEISDLREAIDNIDPDLLIVDVNTWGAAAFAESLGKPWVMFMPYCLPISSSDTPAFGPGFSPPVNWMHRLRDKIVDRVIRSATFGYIKKLNDYRNELGISALKNYDEIFELPDLLLYRTAEPFEYSRKEWISNILKIGPGLWAPPSKEPEWLEKLPSPRILISVSTEKQDDSAIIQTAINSMAGENVSLIVTTGANDPKMFIAPHENVRILKFLSHAAVIDKIDLLVTHGGMGSTQRALASGVPVCVIPCGRDQKETGRRVEVSGSGKMLSLKRLNKKRLKVAINEAMELKKGAEKISRAFANTGGAKKAVEEIMELYK
jgi:MGT family glycosyltransferase